MAHYHQDTSAADREGILNAIWIGLVTLIAVLTLVACTGA